MKNALLILIIICSALLFSEEKDKNGDIIWLHRNDLKVGEQGNAEIKVYLDRMPDKNGLNRCFIHWGARRVIGKVYIKLVSDNDAVFESEDALNGLTLAMGMASFYINLDGKKIETVKVSELGMSVK